MTAEYCSQSKENLKKSFSIVIITFFNWRYFFTVRSKSKSDKSFFSSAKAVHAVLRHRLLTLLTRQNVLASSSDG